MSRQDPSDLVVLSAKVDRRLADLVRALAQREGVAVSVVLRRLLIQAVEEGGVARIERDLHDEGYRAGLDQGRHDFYEHMKRIRP